jgi:multidrug efflux pump subunit AcrB
VLAKLLKHTPRGAARALLQISERAFKRSSRFMGGRCAGCCKHQTATLLVALGTLVLTIVLYIIVPKGFFPVQDTGIIQGISEASQSYFVSRDGRAAAGAGARSFCRIRRSRIFLRSSASTARTPR